jgi:hypothetical protein
MSRSKEDNVAEEISERKEEQMVNERKKLFPA